MDVHELQNIMTEFGKIKNIKGIYHQDVGTENRVMICYETEMEAQRAITEIKSSNIYADKQEDNTNRKKILDLEKEFK